MTIKAQNKKTANPIGSKGNSVIRRQIFLKILIFSKRLGKILIHKTRIGYHEKEVKKNNF